jgi:hypothetical protein
VPAIVAGHRLRRIDVGADVAEDEGAKRASSAERAVERVGIEGVPATSETAEIVLAGLDATDVDAELEEVRTMRPGEVVAEEEVLVDLNGSVADAIPNTLEAGGTKAAEAGKSLFSRRLMPFDGCFSRSRRSRICFVVQNGWLILKRNRI